MNAIAHDLIFAVRNNGGNLTVAGSRLKIEAPSPLPTNVVEALRFHKGEVVAFLSAVAGVKGALSVEDWRTFFDEWVSLSERNGLSRSEAEIRAYSHCIVHWQNIIQPDIAGGDICPVCNHHLGKFPVAVLRPGGGHIWMHSECVGPMNIRCREEAKQNLEQMGIGTAQSTTACD